jgi:hypothetical protein
MKDINGNTINNGDSVKIVGDKDLKPLIFFNYFEGEVFKIFGNFKVDVSSSPKFGEWNKRLIEHRGRGSDGICYLSRNNIIKVSLADIFQSVKLHS